MTDFKALAAPFDPSEISWRVGSVTKDKLKGMALAYLDARTVADRLDAVCGPDGWQCKYTHAAQKTVCDIGVLCDTGWLWKADGAGDSDIEAEKGALSDAFKRAAVRWGIGRYLYDLDSPWVELDEWKRIKPSEKTKLNDILRRKTSDLRGTGTMGKDTYAEATQISQQQAAARTTNGQAPVRKPNPSMGEWTIYMVEDIKSCLSSEELDIRLDDPDNREKIEKVKEKRHSLWEQIDEAARVQRDKLIAIGA